VFLYVKDCVAFIASMTVFFLYYFVDNNYLDNKTYILILQLHCTIILLSINRQLLDNIIIPVNSQRYG
jgi:hypothetical protein